MREVSLRNGEYYHIYNRGTDKRDIFLESADYYRFLKSLKEFNQIDPVISLYVRERMGVAVRPLQTLQTEKIVKIISYCLNPNHFHLILKQLKNGGISEFMKRVGGGYTGYFNHKNDKNGVLFQGKFKAAHIDSNEKLIYLSAYVNGNHRVHGIQNMEKFSSLSEYSNGKNILCNPKIILSQFSSTEDYLKYVEKTTQEIGEIREDMKKYQLE